MFAEVTREKLVGGCEGGGAKSIPHHEQMKELWNEEVEMQNLAEQMLRFLGPEFIPNQRKCLQEKKDAIFG